MGILSFHPQGLKPIWERAAHLPELPRSDPSLTSAWLGEAVALGRQKKRFAAAPGAFPLPLFAPPSLPSCAWCVVSAGFRSRDHPSVCSTQHIAVLVRS